MWIQNVSSTFLRWSLCLCLLLPAILLIGTGSVRADSAAFDLAGPRVDMKVSRAGKTLAISEVPNLQAGDRLWIHVDLPESQQVRYLLVAAFLRGSTNPPPDHWFTKVETWNKKIREEGSLLTVPEGAQQALLFLAPETGGDFSTLRSTVRRKPGIFVRASQDLNQASLYRLRLDKYLNQVKETSQTDPKELHDRSVLLARTLGIKLDPQCFEKPEEQQAPCLTQNSEQLVLEDGHSQSMVAALTSGPSTDLVGAISSTPMAGGGFYSAYVGAIVDVVKLLGNFRSAEYQYIPALALPKRDELNLRLNNPPSFHNPKSVLVVALPAVEAAQLPPLRPVNTDQVFCLQHPSLTLPVEGAPLVFSTDIGHDFVLRLSTKDGDNMDLPATADPARGGFVIDTRLLDAAKLAPQVKGTLRGSWGFESYEGPAFHLQTSHAVQWTVPSAERSSLIVDRVDTIHLDSECAVCVENIKVENQQKKAITTAWKLLKSDRLELQVPMNGEASGPMKIAVKQFGLATPDELSLLAYSEAARLDKFAFNAGDQQGTLKGTRLDEVDSFELNGIRFVPAKLSRANQQDELRLAAQSAPPMTALQPEQTLVAHVSLKDGRVLDLQMTVEPPRPKVTLVSKNVTGPTPSAIRFANQDELPQGGRISFFLKTEIPEKFPVSEKIEVATADETYHALLSVADGSLIPQDSQNILVVFDPLKSFGGSAFGSLRFRPVDADGGKGDWQPLANLVRIPTLKDVRCPDSPDKQCRLSGTNLFLIDSIASDSQFTHVVPVPIGYMDATLIVPRPNGTLLYLKLRDDPATAIPAALPVLPDDH